MNMVNSAFLLFRDYDHGFRLLFLLFRDNDHGFCCFLAVPRWGPLFTMMNCRSAMATIVYTDVQLTQTGENGLRLDAHS
ncbi:hypothetical protein DPMN_148294 [Dreissena polymorpha]|uniref:Uncharacterized protein n=1 Tax=Dreissena polymorpha TaxID=45954 RepID=A0A9D4FDS8_DREPO|nr:hypothetical protein DPMN_148294 [Dreissena polymorpha]